jgi:hypothetical protein
MGLGKTIQTIALLLSGVYQPAEPQAQGGRGGGGGGTARKPRKQQQEQAAAAAAAAAPARGAPTLVICPTSAMVQWADEIKAFAVSRPFPSWNRSILTVIYLCHACSCQEILRTETAGQAHPPPGCAEHHRGFDDQSGAEHDDRARHWQESRWRVQIQAHRSPRRQNCDALWRAVGS